MSNVAADSLVGSTLGGKYTIEALIGSGAMGAVYRAHQMSLHKTVAIKVLHRPLAEQPSFAERFEREAFSASRLDHPNSLRVLDFGQSDGLLYLVMEFAQGDDLLTVMEREWPFDNRRIVDIVSQALAALATAHDLGIIHRDLKPENILLLRGTDDEGKPVDVVKVCDFGIAKMVKSAESGLSFSRHLTTEGFVVGTPDYMSPEQARGEEIDGRSDLYSIGVVLYHLLVGQLPFSAATPLGIVLRHISEPPPRPSLHTKVDARLEAICLQALSKDPRDRFQNARDMRRALRAALDGDEAALASPPAPTAYSTDTTAPSPSPADDLAAGSRAWRKVWSFPRRVPIGGRAAVLLGAAVGFGGFMLSMQYLSPRPVARPALIVTSADNPLASPSASSGDSPPAPIGVAPATPADEPGRPAEDPSNRAQAGSDEHRSEKSVVHTTAIASPGGSAPPGAVHENEATSPVIPSEVLGQPSSLPSTETLAPSASSTPEIPLPAASEPAPRPSSPPAPTAAAVAPVVDPAVPSALPLADPSRASVAIGTIATTGGISAAKVRVALARVPFTACYRSALAHRPSVAPMEASLRITIDVNGRVTGAALSSDGDLPGLRPCIESRARGLSIRDVDTGDGAAVMTLTFSPR